MSQKCFGCSLFGKAMFGSRVLVEATSQHFGGTLGREVILGVLVVQYICMSQPCVSSLR